MEGEMKKRRLFILGTSLLLLVISGSAAGFSINSGDNTIEKQKTEVAEDKVAVTISGNGYIRASDEAWLTFGTSGRVAYVYVEEGDEVKKNDILAKLETDALELALNEAQVTLNQRRAAFNQAQVAVSQARAAETQVQASVTQAEMALQAAGYELEQTEDTYTLSDIKAAESDVDTVKRDLEEALWTLYKYDPGTPGWEAQQKRVNQAKLRLEAAEDKLDAMLYGTDTKEITVKKLRVEAARQSLEAARQSLDPARRSIELAQQSLEIAEQSVALAGRSVELSQKQLDDASLTAPFDGVIARVPAEEGDMIPSPNLAPLPVIQLVNYEHMELLVEIDEIDIPFVKVGQEVTITVDALPGTGFRGEVQTIFPVPKVIGGVVIYDVKVKFDLPEGSGIRVGMNATAHLTATTQSDFTLPNNSNKLSPIR
jgi:multidrug efflux pump subunit AcrA (membrane-fusion protein)